MEHNINISGNGATVTLSGRFTFTDNKDFRDILSKFEEGILNCTLDVKNLEFIDSAGLGMIILANDTVSDNGGSFILRSPQGQVRKMLELTRFGDIITVEN
ncbi:MAG: STAS domain-containing protein [Magnetovibrio sp.]|nr:STAS domain-containing protein [Magnetovibrio sp.]